MLDELSEVEFQEWMRYGIVEPWGGHREDWRAGQTISYLVKAFSGQKVKPEDVFPNLAERREQTAEEMKRNMELHMLAVNARGGRRSS
jgi:hypothetical protein